MGTSELIVFLHEELYFVAASGKVKSKTLHRHRLQSYRSWFGLSAVQRKWMIGKFIPCFHASISNTVLPLGCPWSKNDNRYFYNWHFRHILCHVSERANRQGWIKSEDLIWYRRAWAIHPLNNILFISNILSSKRLRFSFKRFFIHKYWSVKYTYKR